jgi:transaldolase
MRALTEAGIDYDDVIAVLIKEGVDKFVTAWSELGETVTQALEAAKSRS